MSGRHKAVVGRRKSGKSGSLSALAVSGGNMKSYGRIAAAGVIATGMLAFGAPSAEAAETLPGGIPCPDSEAAVNQAWILQIQLEFPDLEELVNLSPEDVIEICFPSTPGEGPGTGDPGTGDPGTGGPGTGDPGTGDPGTGDPTDPPFTEPGGDTGGTDDGGVLTPEVPDDSALPPGGGTDDPAGPGNGDGGGQGPDADAPQPDPGQGNGQGGGSKGGAGGPGAGNGNGNGAPSADGPSIGHAPQAGHQPGAVVPATPDGAVPAAPKAVSEFGGVDSTLAYRAPKTSATSESAESAPTGKQALPDTGLGQNVMTEGIAGAGMLGLGLLLVRRGRRSVRGARG